MLALTSWSAVAQTKPRCLPASDGSNPCPTHLLLPREQPLSQMAQVGRAMFFDKRLSGDGSLACASCHDPAHHYGPADARALFLGVGQQGRRAVPSLTYLERQPGFSIGPDLSADDAPPPSIAPPPSEAAHAPKSAANNAASATNLVPQGGLFWDGRVDSLQQQVLGPLYDPGEMNSTPEKAFRRINHAPYTAPLKQLLGASGASNPQQLLSEAQFALARFQIESRDFHPYSSKFDAWLEGRARLTPVEREGYLLFNDPGKGNCAACHVDTPSLEGLPPLFTDHQYEALGAPRNRELPSNHELSHHDLGVCDRVPQGRETLSPYCGMFATPSLRNSATRHLFFHNGVFHKVRQVVDFYVLRDIEPQRFYRRNADGSVRAYDDLPAAYVKNIDRTDAPFGGRPGERPALDEHERDAIVAFLGTLTDR